MESYTFIPDVEWESWRTRIEGLHSTYSNISYGIAGFKMFDVQEVFIDGKQKGEYHVRINGTFSIENILKAVSFFRHHLPGCEVGVIDPDGTLRLEYHIYVKTDDPMRIMSMMETMAMLNDTLLQKME